MKGLFDDSGVPSYEAMIDKLNALQKITSGNRIVQLPKKGEAVFVGDIHGDFEAIVSIVKQVQFLEAMEEKKDMFLVLLGDYGGRGEKILQAINEIITLKLSFPDNVILLRGNHEELGVALFDGTYNNFASHYGIERSEELLDLYCDVMSCLPVVAITENGIIGVHGGIPSSKIKSIDVLNDEDGRTYAREMTWNDPSEDVEMWDENSRGKFARVFGERAFDMFIDVAPVNVMVRAHEAFFNGFKLFFKNRLASIFSNGSERSESSAYSYVEHPVFLRVDLVEDKYEFKTSDFIEVPY
jgi:hypothetical protein